MTAPGPLADAIRRFPLISRKRARALPLAARLRDLADVADEADRNNDLRAASRVRNRAALLATDTGQMAEARQLCHEHAALFLAARPLPMPYATFALEPLVNLVLLKLRCDEPDVAFDLVNTLADAVTSRTDAMLDGYLVPLADLTRPGPDHHECVEWIDSVRLYEGARALVRAGRWDQAHAHLRQGDGITSRIFDGHQVAVISTALGGRPAAALDLLARTPHEEPWEHAVGAALTVLCQLTAGHPAVDAGEAMLAHFGRMNRAQDPLADTRLGLATVDLATATGDTELTDRAARLTAERATQHADAYTAREVLQHPLIRAQLRPLDLHVLAETVEQAGLGRHGPTHEQRRQVTAALRRADNVIVRNLPR
ncbi:hypothetical protein ACIRPK_33380 [Kitasatospora sp. NPDC101801]|uniref:hypothetical protein n=1 Tax=Kitasatospora sp. NPDC101801 TaxID=3364103 RepID=UPI0037F148A1